MTASSKEPVNARLALSGVEAIGELIAGYRGAQTLFTAAALDLFGVFRDGPRSAAEAAGERLLDPRACEVLLDALVALGFLLKDTQGYRNAPVAAEFLLKDSPSSLFYNLRTQQRLWEAWGSLAEVARAGGARPDLIKKLWDPGFTRDYIRGMAEIARRPAAEVAAALAEPALHGLLDVGAGSGSYSLALLDAVPGLEALLLDLPGTLAVTRELVAGQPAADRVGYLESDYRTVEFDRAAFDLVLLSHVTHDESEKDNLDLLRRVKAALRPNGRVAIHDFMLEETRTAPAFGALFAVHMLTYTRGGRTYTEAEYTRWLVQAGFTRIERTDICAGAPNATVLLTGRRD